LADLDRELQQARCEHLVRCKLLPDEASCLATTRPSVNPSRDAAVAAQKITYDGEQARQCVDATASQGCDLAAHDAHIPPAACGEILRGHVADGDDCSIDAECASGTCVPPMACPDTGCCVGKCRATQAPAAAGGPCNQARDCKAGLVCGADLTCHVPGARGDACGSDRECVDGLACLGGATDLPGVCATLPGVGERCPYQRCASENLRCDAATNLCVAVGLSGASCTTSFDCSIYLECDATSHQCREFPRLGMACDGTCIDDSFCMLDSSGATGTCVALLPNNSLCTGDDECVSGYCPDGPVFRGCIDLPVCF
jgi:hypothetical protein